MKRLFTLFAAATIAGELWAGGILTNTNQHIAFLRNPSRDGVIAIDGVYSNPAGVIFLDEGWHLSLNWQYAHQTRTVTSVNPLYKLGAKNGGQEEKTFKGVADAPFLPSIQAAWNKGKWSLQGSFAVTGGGGKCDYSKGVGSFEQAVGKIASGMIESSTQLRQAGIDVPQVSGYDMDGYMRGRQFYFGFTVGAARQLTDHLSVYGGLRLLYGTASYKARIDNIRVIAGGQPTTLPGYFGQVSAALTATGEQLQAGINQYVGAFMAGGMTQEEAMNTPQVQELLGKAEQLKATSATLEGSAAMLAPYADGVNLQSDQDGWGVAPILGIDYRTGRFNFAAKYEFKTRMRMKNSSTAKESSLVEAVNKYRDGTSVPEDSPALLTVGAQWEPANGVRVNAGYHHYFDKSAHWYQHEERKLKRNTQEYTGGVEWDVTKRLTLSTGAQITDYGLSDDYMNDMTFVVDSWSFGLGLAYQLTKKARLNVAYFQTNYGDYHRTTSSAPLISDSFTRTNRVVGVGCDITL